jgi:surfeit locus 1 family protein
MSWRIPLLPTLLVVAAVAIMIALGVWQLRRAEWKGELIARYRASASQAGEVPWPRQANEVPAALYRHSRLTCDRVLAHRAASGRNISGASGWAQVARCALDGGGRADIVLGWTREPRLATWSGGEVRGVVAPGASDGARLVAAPPLAGLEANAAPDPGDLPNNHLAYAGQWFFFAATAAVIYVLALRRRIAGDGSAGGRRL